MDITTVWTISSIFSTLIFVYKEKEDLREYNFYDCISFLIAVLILCIAGPIGLAFILIASALHFITSIIP